MQKVILALRSALCEYESREAQSIIDLLLDEVCGISRIDRIMHPDLLLPDDQRQRLLHCAALLAQGVPVQQALGYEWFCGQRFKVTPDVLIPRPETAELVQWICDDVTAAADASGKDAVSILDIGTGSGCIALSLARLINNSQVTAIDLSTAALSIAKENSYQQGVHNVYFAQCDILNFKDTYIDEQVFNIIVSNPPYICQQEQKDMSPIVMNHEPAMALFVPDDDPLLFYRAIAQFGLSHLSEGGKIYFEINAAYGAETCQMLREMGYHAVTLRQDINGRDRMVRASKYSSLLTSNS